MALDGRGAYPDPARESRGFGALLKELAEGGAELVRGEVRLARTEAAQTIKTLGTGTTEIAIGGVLALLGLLALITGLILLVGDQWLRDHYWAAALIVTVIAGGIAAFFAARGLKLLSPKNLVPDQTIATLEEDKEWLKRLRT